MIDYRYHVTSLAAVFLALGVGVALGAGPLQSTVSDALSGEVSTVRAQNEKIGQQLDSVTLQRDNANGFIEQLGTQFNHDTLKGRSVAVLSMPGVTAEESAEVHKVLEQAGAQVSMVGITDRLISADYEQYRVSLAPQITNYLVQPPAADASAETVLASAIVQMLSDTSTQSALAQIFTATDNALVTLPEAAVKAQSYVIITGGEVTSSATVEAEGLAVSMYADVVAPFAHAPQSAVVVGDASTSAKPLSLIRSQGVEITTIDSFPAPKSLVSIPVALRTASVAGRAIGSQEGATVAVPTLGVASAPVTSNSVPSTPDSATP